MPPNFYFTRLSRKSMIIALLLWLLTASGIQVQSGEFDCSRLALSPKDLPTELQGYVTEQNFVVKCPAESVPTEYNVKLKCSCESGFRREVRYLHKYFSNYKEYRDEKNWTAEMLLGWLVIAENVDQASSLYSEMVEHFQSQEAKVPTNLNEKYGDESAGWVGSSPVKTLKGTLEGSVKRLLAFFRVGPAVCLIYARQWYEDVPGTQLNEESWDREIRFLDPLNCKEFGLKTLRNWSDRLSRELQESKPTPPVEGQPPMRISIKCDKEDKKYESGERVLFTVKIERLVEGTYSYDVKTNMYRGGRYEVAREISFTSTFTFPNGLSKTIALGAGGERRIKTDSGGLYSFAPFAPYLPGTYTVNVGVDPKDYGFPQGYPGITDVAKLTVYEPAVKEPTQKQFASIIELFKKSDCVPSNRKAVDDYHDREWPNSKHPSDMEYGPLNNLLFCKNVRSGDEVITVSNGYNCPGYTAKTLKFLTKLRFGIGYSDVERGLLKGIDYGPIARCAGDMTSIFGNEHRAVVIYNYWQKENWASNGGNIVLDPWPKQMPESFTLTDFRYFYSLSYKPDVGIFMNAYGDPEWMHDDPFWNAFPTVGGAVYWNLEMKELGIKYTVPPETGTSKGDKFFPPQGAESKTLQPPPVSLPASIKTRTGQTVFKCPVVLDIYNGKWQHLGFVNGRLVSEIEGAQLYVNQRSGSDFFWYVSLPEGEYYVRINGIGEGDFHILTTKEGGIQYYNASIRKGETASLELDSKKYGEPLTMPNGEKMTPRTIIIEVLGDGRESDGRGSDSGGIFLIGVGVLVTIFIAMLIIARRRTVMLHMPVFSRREEAKPGKFQIERHLETSICPRCRAVNAKSNMYCLNCGEALEAHSYCEECGREIPVGSVYCQSCGDKQGVA